MEQIMVISSNYPPRIGGPATIVPQISKELSRYFKIKVIAFMEKGLPKYEKKEFELFRSPSFYFFGFSNPISVALRTILLSFYSRIILSKTKAKIIHAHDAHISLIAALFCKYTSFRRVVTITKYAGDSVLEFTNLNNQSNISIEQIMKKPGVKRKLLLSIQKKMFNLSDYVHVHNEYQKSVLIKLYGIPENKILFLTNPIDTKKFSIKKEKSGGKEITLLIAARLVPWKCPEIVIKSVKKLATKITNLKLIIIGDGEEEYKSKLIKLSVDSPNGTILFKGRVKNDLMPKYYQESDILIQASTYEPFSNTILESLSCGTPVLASNTGGNTKLVLNGINGYLFEAGNQKDFEEKLLKMI